MDEDQPDGDPRDVIIYQMFEKVEQWRAAGYGDDVIAKALQDIAEDTANGIQF